MKAMEGVDGASVQRVKRARKERVLAAQRPRVCHLWGGVAQRWSSPELSGCAPVVESSGCRPRGRCHQPLPQSWPSFGACLICPPVQKAHTLVPVCSPSCSGRGGLLPSLPSGLFRGDWEAKSRCGQPMGLERICLVGRTPGTTFITHAHVWCHGNLSP